MRLNTQAKAALAPCRYQLSLDQLVRELLTLLSATPGGPHQLGRDLVADVKQFIGEHPKQDDMCLLCVGRE